MLSHFDARYYLDKELAFSNCMLISSRILNAVYVLIIMLWAWSALYPSHYNWGFHLFAFYPVWVTIFCLGILLILLIPEVRTRALKILQQIANWISHRAPFVLFVLLGGIFFSVMYLFPAKLHLLGDSDIILQLTPRDPYIKDISNNFRDQPLAYFTVRMTQLILGGGSPVDVDYAYRIIDLVAGICYFSLVFVFIKYLKISALEKALIGCLIFFGTKLQFYFGYVENYSFLCVFITGYLISGWLVLKNQIHPMFTFICFIMMISFHLGSIIFLPSLFVIIFHVWRQRRMEVVLYGVLLILLGVVSYFFLNFDIHQTFLSMMSAYRYKLLPLFGWYYAVFSRLHFLDWINAMGHTLPFGLPGAIVLLVIYVRKNKLTDLLFYFLLINAICALGFTFTIITALGMARDWDVLAVFLIPINFILAYLFLDNLSFPKTHHILFLFCTMLVVQSIIWIGINANEEKHLERAQIVSNPLLSGTIATMYYESLANLFLQRQNLERSEYWYERYLTIDSLNPRILANLADVQKKLGKDKEAFENMKRAARASMSPAVFLDLGVDFLHRKDTSKSIEMFKRALQIDSMFGGAHANLAIVYYACHNYKLAAFHGSKGINYGVTNPVFYKITGNAFLLLNDVQQALKYYDVYLKQKPNDVEIKTVRNKIMQGLPKRN